MDMRLQSHNFQMLHKALSRRFEHCITVQNMSANYWMARFKLIANDKSVLIIDLIDDIVPPLIIMQRQDWTKPVSDTQLNGLKSLLDRLDLQYRLGGL
jgi:hypothetical protein